MPRISIKRKSRSFVNGAIRLAKGGNVKLPFEDFYKTINPDFGDTSSYNLREAYNELPLKTLTAWRDNPEKNHLPDTYKLPNHPSFSNESKYYKRGMKAVRWEGDTPVPLMQMKNTTGGKPLEFCKGGSIKLKR